MVPKEEEPAVQTFRVQMPMEDLHDKVSKFWETKALEIKFPTRPLLVAKDQQAVNTLKANLQHNGTRYVPGLPWLSPTIKLPNNRGTATKRLMLLERQFKRDPKFAAQHEAAINEYIRLGHARKVSHEELLVAQEREWYLPHHGVINPQKPA